MDPVIDRDILSLTRVEKPSLMRALMDLAPDYSGQVVSYRKLQGQLGRCGQHHDAGPLPGPAHGRGPDHRAAEVQRQAVPVEAVNPKAERAEHRRHDLRIRYPFKRVRNDSAFWGRLCESVVGAHLHNTLPPDRIVQLRYWRDGAQEVDFVLASGRQLLGIEVKSGRRRGRIAGLEAFEDRFPGAKRLVVGTGGVPFNEFLSEPADFWLEEARRAR